MNSQIRSLLYGIGFAICICQPDLLQAQIHYSHHFTKKLTAIGASFVEPIEGYYKVKMLRRDEFMRYDLVINSHEKEFEMRFEITSKTRSTAPNIRAFSLASSLAINDPHFDIHFHVFPPELAKDYYHADWAAYADFVPKAMLSDKHYARLLCLYHSEKGMITQLMLFNHHDEEKDRRLQTVSFGTEESSATLPGR